MHHFQFTPLAEFPSNAPTNPYTPILFKILVTLPQRVSPSSVNGILGLYLCHVIKLKRTNKQLGRKLAARDWKEVADRENKRRIIRGAIG